jgi:hypothetical protein
LAELDSGRSHKNVPCDLSDFASVEALGKKLQRESAPELLVNNAGLPAMSGFTDSDIGYEIRMISVNVHAPVLLSRSVLPGMVSRGRGGIINVASLAGLLGRFSGVTYTGTKAFLIGFSQRLAEEVGRRGIRVQALCPGTLSVPFGKAQQSFDSVPAPLLLSPDTVAGESLKALTGGCVVYVPGGAPKLVAFCGRFGMAGRMLALLYRIYGTGRRSRQRVERSRA